MRTALLTIALLATGCRDRVDRKELAKATALAEHPVPPSGADVAPGCPAGAEAMGAPRPRGSGEWCQKVEADRVTIFRLDGTRWAEGGIDDNGLQGEVTFFAPDGAIALVRKYKNNDTDGPDDVRVEGVELPPSIAPVCRSTEDGRATTTKCPASAAAAPTAAPKCPAGAKLMGTSSPDGPGMWCEKVEAGRVQLFRVDGRLWGEGSGDGEDIHGDFTFYAPDGAVALVRRYYKSARISDDVRIEGVELPPLIASVCLRDWSMKKLGTTTKCPSD